VEPGWKSEVARLVTEWAGLRTKPLGLRQNSHRLRL